MEEYAFRWGHGALLVVLQFLANTAFAFLGITLAFTTLGSPIESLSALFLVIISFVLMPIIYGLLSAKLSETFGDTTFPEIDVKELIMMWMHGLVLSVGLLLVTLTFGVFGIAFSITIFETALESVTALIFVIVAVLALPYIFGYISHGLTELLH